MSDELSDEILKAHARTYQRALEAAVRHGRPLIYGHDGKVERVEPPYRYELVPVKKRKKKGG
jgi:hypothetical protein